MKKIIALLVVMIAFVAGSFAQQPTTNLYMHTNSLPPYAVGTNNGSVLTYSYLHAAVPASGHDTQKIVTTANIAYIEYDSINGNKTSPFVIMADSTGDTAKFSNYPTGKATVWYKKNPFQLNYQCDEVTFIFHGNQTSYSTVKFGAFFRATGITAADTLHIPLYVKSTGAGGGSATFRYDYYTNQWVLKNYATW